MTDKRVKQGAETQIRPLPRPKTDRDQAETRPRPLPGQVEKRG